MQEKSLTLIFCALSGILAKLIIFDNTSVNIELN